MEEILAIPSILRKKKTIPPRCMNEAISASTGSKLKWVRTCEVSGITTWERRRLSRVCFSDLPATFRGGMLNDQQYRKTISV